MKHLLFTTALVATTASGAMAQPTPMSPSAAATQQATASDAVPAFRANDFIGKTLYAFDEDTNRELTTQRQTNPSESERLRWDNATLFDENQDAWESVGAIDDVIMTKDGQVQGILVDIGGFLGIGARTVLIEADDLFFVADDTNAEAIDDYRVVASFTRESLEQSPEWDDERLTAGFASERDAYTSDLDPMVQDTTDRPMASAPMNPAADMEMDDQSTPAVHNIDATTAETLIGADVLSSNGETIGSVEDIVLDENQEITHFILDIGGFLGMGTHTVALDVEETVVLGDTANDRLFVQVTLTQDALEALPAYDG